MTNNTKPEEIFQGHRTALFLTVTSQLYAKGTHPFKVGLLTRLGCAACTFTDE